MRQVTRQLLLCLVKLVEDLPELKVLLQLARLGVEDVRIDLNQFHFFIYVRADTSLAFPRIFLLSHSFLLLGEACAADE